MPWLDVTPDVYGGGGAEYALGGLLMVVPNLLIPGIVYRLLSIGSKRYFSKSRLAIGGRASLLLNVSKKRYCVEGPCDSRLSLRDIKRCHLSSSPDVYTIFARLRGITTGFQPCGWRSKRFEAHVRRHQDLL